MTQSFANPRPSASANFFDDDDEHERPMRRGHLSLLSDDIEGATPSCRALWDALNELPGPRAVAVRTLALRLGLSERQVQRARAEGIARGVIACVARTRDNGSRRNGANVWWTKKHEDACGLTDTIDAMELAAKARTSWRTRAQQQADILREALDKGLDHAVTKVARHVPGCDDGIQAAASIPAWAFDELPDDEPDDGLFDPLKWEPDRGSHGEGRVDVLPLQRLPERHLNLRAFRPCHPFSHSCSEERDPRSAREPLRHREGDLPGAASRSSRGTETRAYTRERAREARAEARLLEFLRAYAEAVMLSQVDTRNARRHLAQARVIANAWEILCGRDWLPPLRSKPGPAKAGRPTRGTMRSPTNEALFERLRREGTNR